MKMLVVSLFFGMLLGSGILSRGEMFAQIPPAPRPDEDFVVEQPLFVSRAPEKKLSLETTMSTATAALSIGRTSLAVRESLAPVSRRIAPCVVEVVSDFDRVSLGTVVTEDGLIVAKHSELSKKFQCRLSDGTTFPGTLIGIHPRNDLALIKIDAQGLEAATLNRDFRAEAGIFAVSVGTGPKPLSFGTITSTPQEFNLDQPDCPDCLDLGIKLATGQVTAEFEEYGVTRKRTGRIITEVRPRTPAEHSGLLCGDQLLSLNGSNVQSDVRLQAFSKGIRIGQKLDFEVLREGKRLHLITKIERLTPRTIHDRWGGGPFSERRFGYRQVITHDSVLDPSHCGGPLVTLDGRIVGVNISRSMRVASFAIPIETIIGFVRYVRPNAKLKIDSSNGNDEALQFSTTQSSDSVFSTN